MAIVLPPPYAIACVMQGFDTSQIGDRNALLAAIARGWQPKFVLFWGHTPDTAGKGVGKHVLSQWWPATFVVGRDSYPSAEHFMMAEKARLFGDETTRRAILAALKPGAVKALGRTVAGFDEAKWVHSRFDIVVRASVAKFGQNAELGTYLRETGDKVLVEASPVDAVWGVGLAADDPRALLPGQWPGLNLLGFALMRARAMLAAEAAR